MTREDKSNWRVSWAIFIRPAAGTCENDGIADMICPDCGAEMDQDVRREMSLLRHRFDSTDVRTANFTGSLVT